MKRKHERSIWQEEEKITVERSENGGRLHWKKMKWWDNRFMKMRVERERSEVLKMLVATVELRFS